jgi:GNAT superfamily N-acetyltransferase
MLIELETSQFEGARHLFRGFDYSLSIQAAIEGNNPGRIFVDRLDKPNVALGLTVEGYLLAGDPYNPAANEALRRFFKLKIFTGEIFVHGDWSMSLAVHPEAWEDKLPELIPTHEFEKNQRYHYLCDAVAFDWRAGLPDGYEVRRVDRSLWEDTGINKDVFHEWENMEEMWGTHENFLAKGISYCVVHESEVVSWCNCDCVAGARIDVGIFTQPAYRRRGLGTAAVAATVEKCLEQGYKAVGWHCNADNIGSWKTAERVGFKRNCEYAYYFYIYDLVDHLAELGWYYYRRGEYDNTVRYYEQVFDRRDQNPDYYYHLAASAWALLGNRDNALKYLNAAVDNGWSNAEFTREQGEFNILNAEPGWQRVLARMDSHTGG